MKKAFSITGILAGIVAIILGLCFLGGAFSNGLSYGGDSPYDSGYASFGGDYYTYSVNNSAETASAARATASNVSDVYYLLEDFFGMFMLMFGIMAVCGFGISYAGCKDNSTDEDLREIKEEEVLELEAPQITEDYSETGTDEIN